MISDLWCQVTKPYDTVLDDVHAPLGMLLPAESTDHYSLQLFRLMKNECQKRSVGCVAASRTRPFTHPPTYSRYTLLAVRETSNINASDAGDNVIRANCTRMVDLWPK